jgi:hypothetical protein
MEWLKAAEAAERYKLHKVSVYRLMRRLKDTEHVISLEGSRVISQGYMKATYGLQKGQRQNLATGHQTRSKQAEADPYDAMPVPDLVAEIRARIADKDAEIARLIDQVNHLQNINLEQGKIIGRMALELGQGAPAPTRYVTDVTPEQAEPFEEPKPEPKSKDGKHPFSVWVKATPKSSTGQA